MADLEALADQILRLSDEHGSTPVMVLPSYLSLRSVFFETLVATLGQRTGRSIRIDWCRADSGTFSAFRIA